MSSDKKKIKAYSIETSPYPNYKAIIAPNKINNYHNPNEEVNIYNPNGEVVGVRVVAREINYDSLYNYNLIQDFYFDFAKGKLYSKMVAFIPQINVVTNSGISLGLADHWGIIFQENKRKTIVKKK